MHRCVGCDEQLPEGRYYFCGHCFAQHKEDILTSKPWVKYLRAYSKRQARRELNLLFLEDNMDLDTDGNLIIYRRR